MYLELETYERPATVAAALRLLAAPGAAALAGGTRLNVTGHEHLRTVVDLQALPLAGVAVDAESAWFGALTTLAEVVAADLPAGFAALTEAAVAEKNLAVRNLSTLGGRVSRDRADDRVTTALLALGAEVEVLTADPADAVVRALVSLPERLADIAAGRAAGLVGAVEVPNDLRWSGYLASSLTAVDAPTADAALAVGARGLAIACGVQGATATGSLLLPTTAALAATLSAGAPESEWRPALRAAALAELPAHTDALASGDYRRDLAATLVLRLVSAWLAASGGAA